MNDGFCNHNNHIGNIVQEVKKMEKIIYLRLRHRLEVKENARILLGQVAAIVAPEEIEQQLERFPVYQVTPEDKNTIIIDAITVIEHLQKVFPDYQIQLVGPNHTIVEVILEKAKIPSFLFVVVWLLLFIGSGISIMNFQEDVSMRAVHQEIFYQLTGIDDVRPLTFQIPYSIGLGLGMILFFNHVFKRKLNEEPSPLELEMFQYQQGIDQYLIVNENEESKKHLDDY